MTMTFPRLALARCAAFGLAAALALPTAADAASRIKDIADFQGIRDNQLIGYGLVVGLNGTGDDLGGAVFTKRSLVGMLERMGVSARNLPDEQDTDSFEEDDVEADNVAAVMVTATLPPFARQGSRIDVTVSAIGTASSLLGGTLLVTPLLGADGDVYAVSQGNLAVGGFQVQGAGQTVSRGVPTNARIAGGAIIEREIQYDLRNTDFIRLALRNPDLTTARRMASSINAFLATSAARPADPGTVEMRIPQGFQGDIVELMTDIEQLRVEPDTVARVVIDEQSGTIVMGENVRISTVAIAQGNLTVRITETPQVSQPGAFAPDSATTEVVERTQIDIDAGDDRRFGVVPEAVTLQELVNGLNALGIGPRDMITILQAVKTSGALQADLVVM